MKAWWAALRVSLVKRIDQLMPYLGGCRKMFCSCFDHSEAHLLEKVNQQCRQGEDGKSDDAYSSECQAGPVAPSQNADNLHEGFPPVHRAGDTRPLTLKQRHCSV